MKVFWEHVELILEPLSVKKGLRATLERVRWLQNEGVVIPFATLEHLELANPEGEQIGFLTIKSEAETYRLVLPLLAARRMMGLWFASRLGRSE